MLDAESPVPLYHQVVTELRRSIEQGLWHPDHMIPPERELVEQFKVSRITVRHALSVLVADGLLYRRHGKGTFVSGRSPGQIAETLSELTGHLEELQRRGFDPQVRVISHGSRVIPDEVARALQRPQGSDGWYLYRQVFVDGAPLMLSTVYMPADLGLSPNPGDLAPWGVARLLEAVGHVPTRGIQRIAAETAEPETAHLLGIERGEAVLAVVRVILGTGDRPLVWMNTRYRADRYQYEVELRRRR